MKRILLLWFLLIIFSTNFAQQPKAYQFFDSKGNKVEFEQMIDDLAKADVVFFGELHNNPIAHWFELRITKALYEKTDGNLTLGAEMFEADNQLVLNEYLKGLIRDKDLKNEAKVWSNYETDYKPLVDFAKEHKLPFIATNIPRRYANMVYRKGFEALDELSQQAKQFIAPLPIEYDENLDCYKNMIQGMVHMGMPANPNIAKAQAIKDATMAYFIAKNLPEKGIFIHYNGAYHSDNHQGIVWYLPKYSDKKLIIKTITTVEQSQLDSLETQYLHKADYILVVPKDMTKTY